MVTVAWIRYITLVKWNACAECTSLTTRTCTINLIKWCVIKDDLNEKIMKQITWKVFNKIYSERIGKVFIIRGVVLDVNHFFKCLIKITNFRKIMETQFLAWGKRQDFCHLFLQKGICIFTDQCWGKVSGLHRNSWLMALSVCVWTGSWFSPLWRLPIEFRASILQMIM